MERRLEHGGIIPLYHQLKEILQENIESGAWRPGDLIPSENQLMRVYGVSRNTAKKALDDLVQEGALFRVQGKGTFVAKPKLEQSLSGFYSFSRVMRERGIPARDIILSVETEEVRASVARRLSIDPGEPVIALRRLRCMQEEPIIFETSHIPQRLAPRLSAAGLHDRSLYDLLQADYGIVVAKAKESLEPVLVRDYESRYLHVRAGCPALLLDRVAYDHRGTPVEFCRSIVRGDRCRYVTELF